MDQLLGRIQTDNEVWCRKLPPKNTRFRATMYPVSPTQLPTSVFVLPRIGIRTRPAEPIEAGELFRDAAGRVLLTGEHDITFGPISAGSKVLAAFQMTGQYELRRRSATTTNPTTGLPEQLDLPAADPERVWASIESFTRGDEDAGLRFTVDRLRIVTGTPLVEGDMIAGKTVRRILFTLGIYVGEIQ
jgi:hypothetical protein